MTAGRVVRCARCAGEWVPLANVPAEEPEAGPPPPEPPPPPPPEPPPPDPGAPQPLATVKRSAMARLAAHPATPGSPGVLRVAWAASIALLILLAAIAFAWRSEIVATWPPSARAYAAFGLHPQAGPRQ